ncbi:MAG: hypothetical protein KAI83_13410 [Thiomargarita sp.]|nr:hypothetical protein [Thiomargarita sp.]
MNILVCINKNIVGAILYGCPESLPFPKLKRWTQKTPKAEALYSKKRPILIAQNQLTINN